MDTLGLDVQVKKTIDKENIKKIVVHAPNWVGDTIICTPMISALSEGFPNATLSIVCKPHLKSLWQYNPYTNEIIVCDLKHDYKDIFSYFRLSREIKKKEFDLAIILPHFFQAGLVYLLAGIPNRVGYTFRHRGLLFTIAIEPGKDHRKKHMVENYLDIVRVFGIEPKSRDYCLIIPDDKKSKAKNILRSFGITTRDIVIGINPGATYGSTKRWKKEKYAELCDKLISHYEAKVIIFGGPEDIELANEISNLMNKRSVILAGKTDLDELAALISQCNLFITNDSGSMHISVAVKTPVIGIFGSTSPTWTRPLGHKDLIVKKDIACSPCFKRVCKYGTYECLKSITVDDVLREVEKIILV